MFSAIIITVALLMGLGIAIGIGVWYFQMRALVRKIEGMPKAPIEPKGE